MNNVQSRKFLATMKIVVLVQEFVAFLNAECGDQAIYGFAHRNVAVLQDDQGKTIARFHRCEM